MEGMVFDPPQDPENWRYVVLADGTQGWVRLSDEEKPQWWLDAQRSIERRKSEVVCMFQARAALMQAGLFVTVDAALKQEGGIALQAWEYATEVRRDSDLVKSMAAQLNLTDEQVNSLFE